MIIEVQVTEKHIAEAKHGCRTCPIALAINSLLKGKYQAYVYHISIFVFNKNGWSEKYRVSTPFKLLPYMNSFDIRKKMKPFNFTLDIPDHIIKAYFKSL